MLLQDTVEEVLDPSQELEPVQALAGLSLEAVRQLLTSVHFVQAAYSCIKAHAQAVKGLEELSVQQVGHENRDSQTN